MYKRKSNLKKYSLRYLKFIFFILTLVLAGLFLFVLMNFIGLDGVFLKKVLKQLENESAQNIIEPLSVGNYNGTIWDGTGRWRDGANCALRRGVSVSVTSGGLSWVDDALGGHFDVMNADNGSTTVTLTPPIVCGYQCGTWDVVDTSNGSVVANGTGCVASFNFPGGDFTRTVRFNIVPMPSPAAVGGRVVSHEADGDWYWSGGDCITYPCPCTSSSCSVGSCKEQSGLNIACTSNTTTNATWSCNLNGAYYGTGMIYSQGDPISCTLTNLPTGYECIDPVGCVWNGILDEGTNHWWFEIAIPLSPSPSVIPVCVSPIELNRNYTCLSSDYSNITWSWSSVPGAQIYQVESTDLDKTDWSSPIYFNQTNQTSITKNNILNGDWQARVRVQVSDGSCLAPSSFKYTDSLDPIDCTSPSPSILASPSLLPSPSVLPSLSPSPSSILPSPSASVSPITCQYCGDTTNCLSGQVCDEYPGRCITPLGWSRSDCDCDANCYEGLYCWEDGTSAADYCCRPGEIWNGTSCAYKDGDVNHDGNVDALDLKQLLFNFLKYFTVEDINKDSKANILDAVFIIINWKL